MPLIFFEGFETVGTETGSGSATTTRPRVYKRFVSETGENDGHLIDDVFSEGFAWSNNSGDQTMTFHHVLPDSVHGNPHDGSSHTLICGFRVHIPSDATRDMDFRFVGLENGSLVTDAITLQIVDSQDLVILRGGPAGTQLGSTVTGAFVLDNWHYVEIKVKIAESVNGGLVRVNVDGTEVFSFDGDTNIFSSLNPDDIDYLRILFRTLNHSGNAGDYWALDDIYILDTDGESAPYDDFLGPVRVRSLPPDADVFQNWDNDLEDNDPPNYSHIDENGADDADFVESDVNGAHDRYTVTNLSEDDNILGVKIEAETINVTGGSPSIFLEVTSGASSETQEHVVTVTTDYEILDMYVQDNPAGGAWTPTAINSLQVGLLFENNLS